MNADLDWLVAQNEKIRQRVVAALDQSELNAFDYNWPLVARPAQLPPDGDWRVWLIMAGRGFGKTRPGAEWVRMIAETHCDARIALVSASIADARAVMVEDESGLLACCPPDSRPKFEPSLKTAAIPERGGCAIVFGG